MTALQRSKSLKLPIMQRTYPHPRQGNHHPERSMSPYAKFLPRPTPETQEYWDGLRQQRFLLQRCNVCQRAYFYPRPFCPQLDCHSRDVDSFQASGKGSLYSFVINARPMPGFEDEVPYIIAVVELFRPVLAPGSILRRARVGGLRQGDVGEPV